ncbi:MAG: M48 family metallopeptidase [Xanthomonadales bacterium]|nr:M48 family metallopeptidase [Xanthomonadales bacterium]
MQQQAFFMVDYSNPQPPEGINSSNDNPIKELVILGLGILAVLTLLFFVVSWSAGWLATKIPFRYEQQVGDEIFVNSSEFAASASLQDLADRLAPHMQLDEEIQISAHFSDDDTINAFAFLGGHVVMYDGLIQRLESENALAMVMAHEMAHVKHRDVARSLGRGIALALVSSVLFGDSDGLAARIVGTGFHAGMLSFSREQERAADEAAIAAVNALYGHTDGALQLYEVLEAEQQEGLLRGVEFFNTHPHTESRIEELQSIIDHSTWHQRGTLTPLRLKTDSDS